MEKPVRSFIKAISWRVVATLTTIFLVFALTGSIMISGGVGLGEIILKTLIYYVHERVWNRINFGRGNG